jgi:hypothetical protein
MMNILDEAIQLTDEDGRTFEKVDSSLKYYFDKFNQAYFNGVLAPIKLTWMKGSKLHGYFAYRPIIKEKRFNPICIKLNLNACGTYAAFRNVFVHEMLHYYVHCYTKLPDECWEIAERRANNRDKAGVDKILRNSKDTCHGFEWGRIAIELSAKHPELGNIERYAVKNTETGVALMDADYVAEWAMKNVMLKQEYQGKTYFYVVSVNCPDWKALQEALASGKSGQQRFCGKWTRLFSTLDPNNFEQMRVMRDMMKYYYSIKPEMIRREREIGVVSYDAENASKSGMSQDAINKWCDSVRVFAKDYEEADGAVYFVKRGSKAYAAITHALATGKSNDPDLEGTWYELKINRDPRYFVPFSTNTTSFNGFWKRERVTSKPNFVIDYDYLGRIKVEWDVRVYEPGQYTIKPR